MVVALASVVLMVKGEVEAEVEEKAFSAKCFGGKRKRTSEVSYEKEDGNSGGGFFK